MALSAVCNPWKINEVLNKKKLGFEKDIFVGNLGKGLTV